MVTGSSAVLGTGLKNIADKELSVRPFFYPLSSMPLFFKDNPEKYKDNVNAYDIPHRGLTLPSALNLKDEQIEFYANTVKDILRS